MQSNEICSFADNMENGSSAGGSGDLGSGDSVREGKGSDKGSNNNNTNDNNDHTLNNGSGSEEDGQGTGSGSGSGSEGTAAAELLTMHPKGKLLSSRATRTSRKH